MGRGGRGGSRKGGEKDLPIVVGITQALECRRVVLGWVQHVVVPFCAGEFFHAMVVDARGVAAVLFL